MSVSPQTSRLTNVTASEEAHPWKRLLDDSKYRSAGEIAEAYRITRSFVTRLTLLAPDVVEAILDGRQPPEMSG
jgi:hypothetical protein